MREQLLIDAAAAVEALIDDERLLRAVGREIELEAPQRRRVHGADVQVADLAVARLGDHLAAIGDPALVLQIAERLVVDRRDRHFPRAGARRLVVQQEVELLAQRIGESLPVVVRRLQVAIVERDDELAFLDLQVVLVGGTVLVDASNLVVPGRIGDEIEARDSASAPLPRLLPGAPLTPVCDALSRPIIIIITACSSSSSTR